jgi:hypothetical protein
MFEDVWGFSVLRRQHIVHLGEEHSLLQDVQDTPLFESELEESVNNQTKVYIYQK